MDHIVTSPTSPVPVVVERWLSRSRYLRWIDAGIAWLVLAVLAASVLPRPSAGAIALASAVVLVLATMVPALRVRWPPLSRGIRLARRRAGCDRRSPRPDAAETGRPPRRTSARLRARAGSSQRPSGAWPRPPAR